MICVLPLGVINDDNKNTACLCEKKLASFLFDFGIITPQVLSTQATMTVDNRLQRTQSVDNN